MCLWYAARRCGIYDITDDYLVLLSHGIQVCLRLPLLAPPFILSFAPLSLSLSLSLSLCVCVCAKQERLKDVLEKVTVVSQHRTESLKVSIVH